MALATKPMVDPDPIQKPQGSAYKPVTGQAAPVQAKPAQIPQADTANVATPPQPMPGQGGKKPGGAGGGQVPRGGGYKPGAGGMFGGNVGQGFNPQGGYWGFNPRNVVGISLPEQMATMYSMGMPSVGAPFYNQAASGFGQMMSGQMNPWMQQFIGNAQGLSNLPGSATEAMNLYRQARGVGQQQVTGAGLVDDPAFQAAQQAYESTIIPRIQQQAALAGLGNSTALTNALASAQAQYLLPTVQDTLARQERGIDRELQALFGGAGGLLQGAGMEQQGRLAGVNALGTAGQMANQNLLAGTQGMFGLGNQQQQNMLNAINAMLTTGGTARGISQADQDARYNEWIRQMTGFENALFGPLGMTPGFTGARTIQNKK